MHSVGIKDERTQKRARIVDGGAIAVLPPHYNQIFSKKLDIPDQVYNLVPAKAGYYFVGNVMAVTANRLVGVNDATISVYAASADDEALGVESVEFFSIELGQKSTIIVQNMNVRTLNKGAYVNAITDDDDVYITLLGYYTSEDE